MKVLILSESSGRSRYWEAALPMLKGCEIDICFATVHGKSDIHYELSAKAVEVFSFNARNSKDYPSVIHKLAKFIRENKFDVVHASEAIPATLAGIACLFVKDTKCIFHYHHTYVEGMQRYFSRFGSKLCDAVMAVSKSSQQATTDFEGTPAERTFLAYNGIAPLRDVSRSEIQHLRENLGIHGEARIVTIVARLREVKGHRTLLEACRIAATAISEPLHLIVAGDGEEMGNLVTESTKFDEFKTHFVGHQDDVALYYASADVVAMPSYFEPFGLVAVEAMFCGKALVASNVEGPAEIIENGISGILVPPKDSAALADALVKVFDSPEWAREIGENARKRVLEKFTMETMVESWIDCYKSVLDRPGNNN
jgi:glycosyltransferase involved in cell wall biosynthesis